MASGIEVVEDVLHLFNKMRLNMAGEDPQEHCKFCLFVIDGNYIVPEETSKVRVKDLEGQKNVFKYIMSKVPDTQCRYALYDCAYETTVSPKNDLIFIMWAPEGSTIKDKMKYASSKDAIKKKFVGIKHAWELTDVADLKDEMFFVDKLGGRSVVKALEGRDLDGKDS